MRGSSLKSYFLIAVHRAGRALPGPCIALLIRAVVGALHVAYWAPFNPIRRNCRHITALAARAGIDHHPHAIYRRLLGQISLVLRAFVRVFAHGRDEALRTVPVDDAVRAAIGPVLERHGSLVLAVPHNVCSVFSAMGLPEDRLVLVVRNRKGRHNRVSQDVIRRMRLPTLEVRDLSPIALSRAMMKALGEGKVLITTVDNTYRKADAVAVDIFGRPKGFGPWAARIAARRGVPVLPCYPRSEDGVVGAWFGEPLVDADPAALIEHYVRFFEDCILRDPGSWAFLGDKRWGRHLAAAIAAQTA